MEITDLLMYSKKCTICKTTYNGDLSLHFSPRARRGKACLQSFCKRCHELHYKRAEMRRIGKGFPSVKKTVKLGFDGRSKAMVNSAKARARYKKIEFSIDSDMVNDLFIKQGYKCCLTGIDFDLGRSESFRRNPLSPSLDRINCKQGYVPDNVRIVLTCVNIAINDWDHSVLDLWVDHYVKNRKAPEPPYQ
jgi:hypothetical protein